MDAIKKYWNFAYIIILPLIPALCMCAGTFWTICKALNYYPEISWYAILFFDCSQIIYMIISLYIIFQNKKNPHYISGNLFQIKCYIMLLVIIQYSIILFLFPATYTWECTIIFLLITVFFFDTKMQIINSVFCFSSLTFSYILRPDKFFPERTTQSFQMLAFQIVILVLTIFTLIIIVYQTELFLIQAQENSDNTTHLLEKQLSYYKQVDLMDKELRKFRHDIKNHFICIDALLEQGKSTELSEYFKDLLESFNSKERLYYTGNDVTDAILNSELNYHFDKQISVSVSGKLPAIETISSMDMCTIFSNMLTNAIHATSVCDAAIEPKLNIQFQSGSQYFSIIVQNSTKNPLKTISSKMNRNHGHGLYIIRDTVEKYNGFFEQSEDNHMVTTTVLLPL